MKPILVMNGGVGTELIRRGVSCPAPLWSVAGFRQPEILKDIYRDYLQAGARALTTNTFRTGWQDIAQAELPPEEFLRLNRLAIQITDEIIQEGGGGGGRVKVMGSISSMADCYHPEWVPPDLDYLELTHRHQMELFAYDPRVDVILAETLGDQEEVSALLRLRNQGACGGKPCWISLLCKDKGTLLDETPLTSVWNQMDHLGWPDAIGFNCVAPDRITELLEQNQTPVRQSGKDLMAYGHLGRRDSAGRWVHKDVMAPDQYAGMVLRWVDLGASIVGGCCGTTPGHIRAIGEVLPV